MDFSYKQNSALELQGSQDGRTSWLPLPPATFDEYAGAHLILSGQRYRTLKGR